MAVTDVPPGGFIAFGQQTMATQSLLRKKRAKKRRKKTTRSVTAPKRRKAATKKRAPKRAPRRGKGGRLVKGSAAAKRHMAKLRKMRKT